MNITSEHDRRDQPADPVAARDALAGLWRAAGLPAEALSAVELPGHEPILPSSFAVATAAQASLAAAALAAVEVLRRRTGRAQVQRVGIDMRHAALDCCCHFLLDGIAPDQWDKLSGLYPCGADVGEPGHVRIHANFAHHRDGALALLGCPTGPETERISIEQALRRWRAQDFEQAAADAGLVVAAVRSFEEWDRHPQALAIGALPTVCIERIDGAPDARPLPWPAAGLDAVDARPLQGLRVLDLTRILAGPVAGRTLGVYGADVMLVNSPALPNIAAIAETSRGKLSAHIDLRHATGRDSLRALVRDAHVFLQAYRPDGLAALGFGPQELARLRPGIVVVSLSAYGHTGPWAGRRGFDSLVQTATGFNLAEAQAAGSSKPRALPMQILDYAAGHLLAFGAQAALLRQQAEGGSWHVRVSLAGVGTWLRGLGRVPHGLAAIRPAFDEPAFDEYLETLPSGFGRLTALRHPARFEFAPTTWTRPAMPPGTHAPVWPDAITPGKDF